MNERTKKRRKWLWLGGGLLLITMIAIVALPMLRARAMARQQAAVVDAGETVTVMTGDLAANATASGQVQAQRAAELALAQSGYIAEVYVQVGDRVAAGEALLTLDTAVLERAVSSAQQTLTIQEANLATLLAPATTADLAAAEANVASAQAALDGLLAGPDTDEIAKAEADVRAANADITAAAAQLNDARAGASAAEIEAAQIQLDLAQTAATRAAEQHSTILVTEPEGFLSAETLADLEFSARAQALQANATLAAAQETVERLLNGDGNAIAAASAQAALAAAQRDAAQATLGLLLLGPSAAQIAAAEATLAQAQATLDRLQRGPSQSQIVQMETAVVQARVALQRAENDLAEATLYAPFDGVVTAVNGQPGEQASGILVALVDPASLEVVLDVDEVDIGKVNVGQPATLTLESWPDVDIVGEVVSIAPIATQDNTAVVSYQVYISLGETELPVLVGMTANARLLTDTVKDVLLVPNAAINANREKGTYTVNKVITNASGAQTLTEVEVTIGLRDGRYTQITSGLQAGDELIIGSVTPRFQFGNGDGPPDNGQGGGPFGGGQ